jgi:hypothetical protein
VIRVYLLRMQNPSYDTSRYAGPLCPTGLPSRRALATNLRSVIVLTIEATACEQIVHALWLAHLLLSIRQATLYPMRRRRLQQSRCLFLTLTK